MKFSVWICKHEPWLSINKELFHHYIIFHELLHKILGFIPDLVFVDDIIAIIKNAQQVEAQGGKQTL